MNQSLWYESSSARNGLRDSISPRESTGRLNDLRILVVISNRVSHPLLVCFLLRETGTSSDTEDDRKEHKSVKCPGDDQGQPHAEVVDLSNVRQRPK